jgi:hypothetical protein
MTTNLEEIKKRLERAQNVIVDKGGKLIPPADSEARRIETTDQEEETEIPERSVLKPSRWYAVL